MKKTFLTLVFFLGAVAFFIKISDLFSQSVDFGKLAEKWELFMQEASENNARTIYELLPLVGRVNVPEEQKELLQKINDHLNLLEAELYDGKADFVKLTFSLYSLNDEKLTSNIDRLLCNLLAFKPAIFLSELGLRRKLVPNLESLLGAYKFIAAETGNSEEVEKNLRIKSLESVEEKELKDIKKECLKILKKL